MDFIEKHFDAIVTIGGLFLCAVGVLLFVGISWFILKPVERSPELEVQAQEPQEEAIEMVSPMRVLEYGELHEVFEDGSRSSWGFWRVLVDEETGVMYYTEYVGGYQYGGPSITPLYNADGTLRIYQGD